MQNSLRVHAYYGIAIGLLVIGLIIRDCDKSNNDSDLDYRYKTDTVIVDKDYQARYNDLKKTYDKLRLEKTPPKKVIEYKDRIIKGKVEKITDSVIVYIDSTKTRIGINDDYLKKFAHNDKLIEFKLVKDSFNLSTISIDGKERSRQYPISLEKYDYYWYDNELHHTKTKNPQIGKKIKERLHNLYINGGYDFLMKSPTIGTEYFIPLGKFKLGAEGRMYIQQNPQINLNVNLGYRIF